jgi:hypothetical protein
MPSRHYRPSTPTADGNTGGTAECYRLTRLQRGMYCSARAGINPAVQSHCHLLEDER